MTRTTRLPEDLVSRGIAALLVTLAASACAAAGDVAPTLDGLLVHDPACAAETGDCMQLVAPGAYVDLAAFEGEELELLFHSDGPDLGEVESWVAVQDGVARELSVVAGDENQAGSDVTLSAPALVPGEVVIEARIGGAAVASYRFFAARGALPAYGSTYNSSCACSYCQMWCSTKGGGVKYAGYCC